MRPEQLREFYLKEYAALKGRPAPPRSGRNLVLGLAANLGKADIEVFVNSLRRSGYRDAIVLFVTTLDAETETFLQERSVTAIRTFNTLFSPLHPTFMRYALYYDYLASQRAGGVAYDNVFLSDVSDVVFQRDPFEAHRAYKLTVFVESPATIGRCPANGGWVKLAFGDEEFAKLRDEQIYCSGTTMGPGEAVVDYLLKMLLGATNANPVSLEIHGVDQGIHNYLIHNAWLPDCARSENGAVVLTLHYHLANGGDINVTGEGAICDADARVIPVIHQYNRSDHLTQAYRRKYAA